VTVEKEKIAKLVGTLSGELYIGWYSFVQNMLKLLQERGADRKSIVITLLWFNGIEISKMI
jgi:hypothetical protein